MVKECHKRGIEVIMDVVFNHTAEGNEMGPTLSFRCAAPSPAPGWPRPWHASPAPTLTYIHSSTPGQHEYAK
jgi:glycosidase